jgi:site-specific DNA-cytosine methylase
VILIPSWREVLHFHLFAGLGGGARGFNRGSARVGIHQAKFRCLGGIDNDKDAIADFTRLTGVRGTVLDLFDREQYIAFHGHEPPAGWRPATPADVRVAAHGGRPNIVFLSPPCKSFSGLLSEARSLTAKYQALNHLALRGIWLALEAWKDDPPEFFLIENVPRIATRGRGIIDQVGELLDGYGYAYAETTHDCGELGGLGQRRKRFLLVARHREKVPPFLYEPPKRPLRSVGDVIGRLPIPGPDMVLPMHRLPSLQWQTWLRLAFVEAGSDWRSLNKLRVADGVLQDFRLQPDSSWEGSGYLGVRRWNEPTGVVCGESRPTNGAHSVADPRIDGHAKSVQMGVGSWDTPAAVIKGDVSVGTGRYAVADPRYAGDAKWGEGRRGLGVLPWASSAGAVTSQGGPAQGTYSVADPRIPGGPRFNHCYRIVPWGGSAPAIAGGGGPAGGLAVADPRTGYPAVAHTNLLNVVPFDDTARAVTSAAHPAGGALCVADPRPEYSRDGKAVYKTSGEYGVVPWDATAGGVTAAACHDNGRWSVADPRDHAASAAEVRALPAATDRLVALIRAIDGTYHRPFTTLELAALQSLVDPDEILELTGKSDSAHRERIGNAVPPDAAQAIASVMGQTLLLAWAGETFILSAQPVWVQPLAIALSVAPAIYGDVRE